jgi:putative FmdB family regulatory protein
MPLYEYICQQCGERFEKLVRTSEAHAVVCPRCQSASVNRAFSTFATGNTTERGSTSPNCGPVG